MTMTSTRTALLAACVAAAAACPAYAQRAAPARLPEAELRELAEVYDLIMKENVDQVEGRKLIKSAIAGMVSSLGRKARYYDKSENEAEDKLFAAQEAAGELPSVVTKKIIAPGYALLRVTSLPHGLAAELAKELGVLHAQEPRLKGLVLDLRDDEGGALIGAVGLAAVFLPKDSVVAKVAGRDPDRNQTLYARFEDYGFAPFRPGAPVARTDAFASLPGVFKTVPLVVLVNAGTASGAELVAGALQDYRRATVMGTRSAAVGAVGTVRSVGNGNTVILSTALFYTPLGRVIDGAGITPDIVLEDPGASTASAPGGADPALARALAHLRQGAK
jgi:C-terminal processing protease CtpA/Prc